MKSTFWKVLKKVGWGSLILSAALACFAIQQIIALLGIVPLLLGALSRADAAVINMRYIMQILPSLMLNNLGALTLAAHVGTTIVFAVWYYYGCGRPKMKKVSRVLGAKGIISTLVVALGLCAFSEAFVLLAPHYLPEAYKRFEELMKLAGIGEDIFAIIATIILAPIGEELVCRGVVYHYAKKLTEGMKSRVVSFWIANVLQALMFALLHGNLIQGIYAFVGGIFLGILREKYNSLYPSILMHFINNFLASFVVGYFFGLLPQSIPSYFVLGAVSVAFFAAGLLIDKEKRIVKAA